MFNIIGATALAAMIFGGFLWAAFIRPLARIVFGSTQRGGVFNAMRNILAAKEAFDIARGKSSIPEATSPVKTAPKSRVSGTNNTPRISTANLLINR